MMHKHVLIRVCLIARLTVQRVHLFLRLRDPADPHYGLLPAEQGTLLPLGLEELVGLLLDLLPGDQGLSLLEKENEVGFQVLEVEFVLGASLHIGGHSLMLVEVLDPRQVVIRF